MGFSLQLGLLSNTDPLYEKQIAAYGSRIWAVAIIQRRTGFIIRVLMSISEMPKRTTRSVPTRNTTKYGLLHQKMREAS